MVRHLHRNIEQLKKKIFTLCALVEETVIKALESFSNGDLRLATRVVREDIDIDRMEIAVEEYCLQILALNQPVANDLRFIVATLKMNNDLERIGDLAVNIAQQTLVLSHNTRPEIPADLGDMAQKARNMLKTSLDSLVNLDADQARAVLDEDDEVDAGLRRMYGLFKEKIGEQPNCVDSFMCLLMVARHLERIADLATNLAEDVIYLVEGEIVRHQHKVKMKDDSIQEQKGNSDGK
ncbi:MAG: phosphate signaling complex protein PhoU [Planctomycetota bacterium]